MHPPLLHAVVPHQCPILPAGHGRSSSWLPQAVPLLLSLRHCHGHSFIIYAWLPAHGPEGARNKFHQGFELFRSGVLRVDPGVCIPTKPTDTDTRKITLLCVAPTICLKRGGAFASCGAATVKMVHT